jgi:hypothetical protein
MKYLIVKGCAWKDFCTYGMEGQEIDAAKLVAEGKPLPKAVLDHFVSGGSLKPVEGGEK